jgi:hypothetical protein
MQEIEKKLRTPPPKAETSQPAPPADSKATAGKAAEAAPAPAPPPPMPAPQKVEVGNALDNMPSTDPLKLIKSATVPLLSGEKRKKQATPLEFLVQVRSARNV